MAKKKPTREGTVPPPKCKAILLCERTIIEAGTGRITLIGLFEELEIRPVPGKSGPFVIYLLLTDGIVGRDYEISIEIHDLDNDIVVARAADTVVRWTDRFTKVNLLFPVPSLDVECAGSYDIIVFADRQEVDRQRFEILAPKGSEDEEE